MRLTSAQQKLVTDHLHLVRVIFRAMIRKRPTLARLGEDAIGAGLAALCEAALHFDQSRGILFRTYADRAIRHAILFLAKNQSLVCIPGNVMARLFGEHHAKPVPPARLQAARFALAAVPIDDVRTGPEADGDRFSPPAPAAAEALELDFQDLIADLDPQEQALVTGLYVDGLTTDQLGPQANRTGETIRLVKNKAVWRLRLRALRRGEIPPHLEPCIMAVQQKENLVNYLQRLQRRYRERLKQLAGELTEARQQLRQSRRAAERQLAGGQRQTA